MNYPERDHSGDAVSAISDLLRSAVDVDETVRKEALNVLNATDPAWSRNAEAQKAVPELVAKLKSRSSGVRTAAFRLLSEIGPLAVPGLVKVLSDEQDTADKLYAIQLLARIGPGASSAIPGLIRALDSELLQIRIAAAKALGEFGPAAEAAVWVLAAGLTDKYPDGRAAKANCLACIGRAAEPALPALLPLLADREEKVRQAAGAALEQIGPVVVPKLMEIIQTRDVQRLKMWFESMINMSELYNQVKSHPDLRDYRRTLRNLSWVIQDMREERASLEAAQETALQVLEKFGPAASKAGPTVAKALTDPNPRIKLAAIQALGQIEPGAKRVRPDLIQMLTHSNKSLQEAAAKALGNIDRDWASDPVIVSAFEDLAKQLDKGGSSGETAVHAFTVIGSAAVPVLIDVLESGERVARQNAAKALGGMGAGAKTAIPALTRALEDKHRWVQDEAAKALAKINDHTA